MSDCVFVRCESERERTSRGLMLVVFALFVASGVLQVRFAVSMRPELDASEWHDLVTIFGTLVASYGLLAWLLLKDAEISARHGSWTRIVVGDDGIRASGPLRERKVEWRGSRLETRAGGVAVRGRGGPIVISGSWSEAPDGQEPREPEWLSSRTWRATSLGAMLLARSEERVRRGPRPIAVICTVLAFLPIAVLAVLLPSLMRALDGDAAATPAARVEAGRKLLESRPRSARAWSRLSRALLDAGRPQEALEAAERGLALGDRPEWLLDERSLALERLGRPREAARDRAGLIGAGFAWTNAAEASRLLLLAGDVSGARHQAERAVAMRRTPGTLQALVRVEEAERRLLDSGRLSATSSEATGPGRAGDRHRR